VTDLSAFSLEGKTVMVTGANTGIGQGIAAAIARAGGTVVGVGRSDMSETAALIGDAFTSVACDLADKDAAVSMLTHAWADRPIDGLVNNAGIIRRADAVDFTEEDWDAVFAVNLRSLFFLSQAFGRAVLSAGRTGKIVNVASLLSFQGGIRVPAYTASKHAVAGVTQALSNEWAARGINVNAIAPGYIESNNTKALRADPDRSAAILARIPAGRWGQPSDIGDAAVFLLSAASNYMHGAIIPVDGGWLGR
jgi:2-deoxy-D-gluconate 3-dehydrogenase